MAFTGDLEHLPIVDVIQLLHSTRKSGILRVKSRKGESQLVFKEGYIVSASHLNNSVRIGTILVDLGMILQETLDRALEMQKLALHDRKPLVVTLVEQGLVKEKDAYKGLEQLIEMTIVEMLTWKKGTFVLDVLPTKVADEYRYYPDKMTLEINVDTQSILMDSLRLYDEKVRDGKVVDEDPDEECPEDSLPDEGMRIISADDLGLGDLDETEQTTPKILKGVTIFDPNKMHRQKIREAAPDLLPEEQEQLVLFLGRLTPEGGETKGEEGCSPSLSLVLFSADELLKYAMVSMCAVAGIPASTTDDEQALGRLVTEMILAGSTPLVVLDIAGRERGMVPVMKLESVRRLIRERYPAVPALQLAAPTDAAFSLQAYRQGIRAVLPRPVRETSGERFVTDIIGLLETVTLYLKGEACVPGNRLAVLKRNLANLRTLRDAPEVSVALLQFVGETFERSLTLIVRGTELIAERGIGISSDRSTAISPALGLRIPVAPHTLLHRVIESGRLHFGAPEDAAIGTHLYPSIGVPVQPAILLLPLRSRGKTLSVTYADFGTGHVRAADTDSFEIFAEMADIILENAYHRKKLQPPV